MMRSHQKSITSVLDAFEIVRNCLQIIDGGTAISTDAPYHDALVGLLNGLPKKPRTSAPFELQQGVWFRGQPNEELPLLPTAFRKINNSAPSWETERRTIIDFKRRHADWPGRIEDIVDWLCLLQHHKGHTRLLDWTQNILVALYFACEETKDTTDGALFVLNSFRLNQITWNGDAKSPVFHAEDLPVWFRAIQSECNTLEQIKSKLCSKRRGELGVFIRAINEHTKNVQESPGTVLFQNSPHMVGPTTFYPRYIHERMRRQQSVFVIFGGIINGHPNAPDAIGKPRTLECLVKQYRDSLLFKVRIPRSEKAKIRRELRLLGVYEGTLFPELEHQ